MAGVQKSGRKAPAKRRYSFKTLKVLYGLSGNRCAYPDCLNPVIRDSTEFSDHHVSGHIAHIYPVGEKGPRAKPGLTPKELNAPGNLLLLCPTHHDLVDGQWETYPPELLQKWKSEHESKSKIDKRLSASLRDAPSGTFSSPRFPTALVDERIAEDIRQLRQARFFGEYDAPRKALAIGGRLVDGELSAGSDRVRSNALSWCARVLSGAEDTDRAEEFLTLAKGLGEVPEVAIAEAAIASQKGDRTESMQVLRAIDTASSRSAAFILTVRDEGAESALTWLGNAGIAAEDLDSDGKAALLGHQISLARWDAAFETLSALTDGDFGENLLLHRLVGITKLLRAVPDDLRAAVSRQVPFEARRVPLASNAAAMDARREAQDHFLEAAAVERDIGCLHAAGFDEEYALWLELRDPAQMEQGKSRLEAKLRHPQTALGLIPLAVQWDIKLDLEAVEREIQREFALNGGATPNVAKARFALAFIQGTPEELVNYITRYEDQLAEHIEPSLIQHLQIEMLSRAGLRDKAEDYLAKLIAEGISAEEEQGLRRVIDHAEADDPVQPLVVQYKATRTLGDLMTLVDELESRQLWIDLCEFGRRLFEETRSLQDAERLVRALGNAQRSEHIVEFLRANPDFLAQSGALQVSYAWALFNEGELIESRAVFENLEKDSDPHNYRALRVNLGIALGDWNSLYGHIDDEFKNREHRSASDLMRAATLAVRLGSPHARELVTVAAEKAGDDVAILASAYLLASRAGWEDDSRVFKWLEKAAEHSGDDGPLQRMSLREVFDRKPEWDRKESETWRLLGRGEIPLFLAAQSLRRPLVELTIFPALSNPHEVDPRRRRLVPIYSGGRKAKTLDLSDAIVGIEPTALLTLGHLGLIDRAIGAFKTVYIAHSTLSWLFDEKQEVAFHQPSRVREARQLLDLIATDMLERLFPSTAANEHLAAEVGDELACLIAEAEKVREDDGSQRIVVRPAPVHRVYTFMEEDADLSSHAAALSSCRAVVDKLRQKGQITADEQKRALAFLQLHEKQWPNQPEIKDGAVLYLDDLAINYLLHLKMLGKLKPAGLRALASSSAVSEANALISHQRITEGVATTIERIRSTLSSHIESGRVKLGRHFRSDGHQEDRLWEEHPTIGMIALAPKCDAVVADDRFINQRERIDGGGGQAPIFTTLDILDALATTGEISPEDRLEYLTRLRRSGYCFVPLGKEELEFHLKASTVRDGRVVEGAELKAIRESVLQVRMSNWLQLPKEAAWLDETLRVYTEALKGLWINGADIARVKAQSNWIIDQVDVRGWAHAVDPEIREHILNVGRGGHIRLLLSPPSTSDRVIVTEYWSWVEAKVVGPIKQQSPELYDSLVKWYAEWIDGVAETELPEGDA